jgi:hypothetical protein
MLFDWDILDPLFSLRWPLCDFIFSIVREKNLSNLNLLVVYSASLTMPLKPKWLSSSHWLHPGSGNCPDLRVPWSS